MAIGHSIVVAEMAVCFGSHSRHKNHGCKCSWHQLNRLSNSYAAHAKSLNKNKLLHYSFYGKFWQRGRGICTCIPFAFIMSIQSSSLADLHLMLFCRPNRKDDPCSAQNKSGLTGVSTTGLCELFNSVGMHADVTSRRAVRKHKPEGAQGV